MNKMYPVGNQSVKADDIETSPTVTDLIEVIDADNTNEKKYISLTNLATLTVAGVTASAAEINRSSGVTAGTIAASKNVVANSAKNVTGLVVSAIDTESMWSGSMWSACERL